MTKAKLLQIGSITDGMRARLSDDFDISELFQQADRKGFLAESGASFVAVLTDGHWGVPDDVVAACPNVRIVSSYGVGYDAIDAPTLAARGIVISHTPDVLNEEVAVTALMLWFAVSRRLISADAWARSGDWERHGSFPLTRSVSNRSVGILGLGRIGQTIAEKAQAFGAHIHYHTRTPKDLPYNYAQTPVALAEAVDVLIVITPGGAATRHLVNEDVLHALGPDGIIINVARGSVIDEPALVRALQSGAIAGAGLDVFEAEPVIPDALKDMPNVVLAPHIGSATIETREAMGNLVCDNLLEFLQKGRVLTPVPECARLNTQDQNQ